MNKTKKLLLVLITFIILLVGCSKKEKLKTKNNEYGTNEYIQVTLKINMPLSIDDLEDVYELPMTKYMKEEGLGEITGDGFPIDDYGPYATDIEFDIPKEKISDFEKILQGYQFPKGSYFSYEDYKSETFGELVGIRLIFNELKKDKIDEIYDELLKLLTESHINTIYSFDDITVAYYYGNDANILIDKINQYKEEHNLKDHLSIMTMPTIIKEKRNN